MEASFVQVYTRPYWFRPRLSVSCVQFKLLASLLLLCPTPISNYGLNRVNLQFVVVNSPPFEVLTRGPGGNYTITGTTMEAYKWLAKYLNFSFTVVPVEDSLIAELGGTEALFHNLINVREVDGILTGFVVTPDRKERMDFTFPIWVELYSLLAPSPNEESRLFAFILPFQPVVWIYFFSTLLAMVVFMSLFSMFYLRHTMRNTRMDTIFNQLGFYTVYVINIITNHGTAYTPYVQHSFRVLIGFWLLAAIVLVNSYSSTVVSSLTVARYSPSITSLEALAASKDVSIITRKDTVVGQQILFRTVNMLFVENQFKKDKKCRFQSTTQFEMPNAFLCPFFKKGSQYTPKMNLGVMLLWETGLTRFWADGLVPISSRQCSSTRKPKTSARQVGIKLEDLRSAFLILAIGIGLASLSFLVEISIARLVHIRRERSQSGGGMLTSTSPSPSPKRIGAHL